MTKQNSGNKPKDNRKQRLAEALRANLQRRKAQARQRQVDEKDDDAPSADDN